MPPSFNSKAINPDGPSPKKPLTRKLQGYAFDPSLSLRIDTAPINNIVYKVIWEDESTDEKRGLKPGPIGEYVEVIDYDPTTGKFYAPINLNDQYILAEDGLEPAESNPQFHQQMVYAVAMTTIRNFENALGRKVIWDSRKLPKGSKPWEEYVQRLRLYPHALRDSNAYYSPEKKAILFGYFEASPVDNTVHMPDSFVFTCLSHDIIAHEVTHAILDGIYPKYSSGTNPDVLAFHEAFADIVALFQHFTFPDVLKHQIAQTRGDLTSQNELGKLAQQFGQATGSRGSLRDALGSTDADGKWTAHKPNGQEYTTVMEPHDRGGILVSAVFEAFLTIYKGRVTDLLRIATGGTGELTKGELHPDLVNRLADEASQAAKHVLNMCIRALDYCPPVDIMYGDYLRAIITADFDMVPADKHNYRLAFLDSFRRRGIYPQGLKMPGLDSLKYKTSQNTNLLVIIKGFLEHYRDKIRFAETREDIYTIAKRAIAEYSEGGITGIHQAISMNLSNSIEFEQITGLVFNDEWPKYGVRTSEVYSAVGNSGKKEKRQLPSFQIQNLRAVTRTGPEGEQVNQIVFCIVQRCGVEIAEDGTPTFAPPDDDKEKAENQFDFYGGCTMIFDLKTMELKYAISRPLYNMSQLKKKDPIREIDAQRVDQQYRFMREDAPLHMGEFAHYFGQGSGRSFNEPFYFLHQD